VEISLYLLILLTEWVLLVTVSAPLFFAGRFNKTPNLGLWLWFSSLGSAVIATIMVVGLASYSIFETWLRLQENDDIIFTLAASVAPWLLMGFAGILIALANQRLSPMFDLAKRYQPRLSEVAREISKYRRATVYELDVPGYLAITKDRGIYLSKSVFELPAKQLEAILRHEYGHIKLRHERVKAFAYGIYQLLPWFAASRALVFEVDRLVELSADKYALKRVYSKDLALARARFS
jgi:Zn-dependent protease with chaperone function